MFDKKELETNILYAKLKIKNILKKKKRNNQDLINLCILNLIQDAAQEELKEFDD